MLRKLSVRLQLSAGSFFRFGVLPTCWALEKLYRWEQRAWAWFCKSWELRRAHYPHLDGWRNCFSSSRRIRRPCQATENKPVQKKSHLFPVGTRTDSWAFAAFSAGFKNIYVRSFQVRVSFYLLQLWIFSPQTYQEMEKIWKKIVFIQFGSV